MERVTDTHVYFWGLKLSNWYPVRFMYKDIEFDNTEQAFMWEKAMLFGDHDTADRILDTPDPKAAKGLGRKVKNFDAERWMINGYTVMVAVNYAKFSQYPRLKSILLNTGNKTIVEASPYDKIWGIGIHWNDDTCLDEANWKGMNLLGKALMEVRKQLRK